MPHSTRVTCPTCRAQLGIVVAGRLTVEGHRVDIGPKGGATITCTACKTSRSWEERKTA